MNFMFSWQEQYLTRSLRSLVRYCSCHSNIKFIFSRHRVISSIYIHLDVTENKTQKNISSHAYNLSNHVIIKVNYTLNGKYKAIVRSNAQFIAIIITELTSTAVFVFQCCRVSGIDHGIDGQQNF